MAYNSGAFYYNTALCGANTGPCISVCHSPCHYNSQYLAAYQNYYSCHGTHLVTCSNFTALKLSGVCPILSLGNCSSKKFYVVSIMSTGPGCVSGGLDPGCTHGHSGTVRKMGDLNRHAIAALGCSCNRIWAKNFTTI
jgi:hypothetical protein